MLDIALLVSFLVGGGIPSKDADTLICIAKYESRMNPKAINYKHNNNRTIDVGLFQINSKHTSMCDVTIAQLFDARTNAKCAIQVYKKQGLKAWVTYKKFCQGV